jgi:hypothetical protein
MSQSSPFPEWSEFAVSAPSQIPNQYERACQPLNFLSHTTHVRNGLDLIQDGEIKAGLVYDESRLNEERILVTWLSPNFWFHGFRYGNISLCFEWGELIAGKTAYWVECIRYSPPACRILLSEVDHSSRLQPYDPTQGNGPWWHDIANDIHYWNGEYCLELMLEDSLPLASATQLSYVDHHASYCSVHRQTPADCRDRGKSQFYAAPEFLACLIGRNMELSQGVTHLFVNDAGPTDALVEAARSLLGRFTMNSSPYVGNRTAPNHALARAVFAAYADAPEPEMWTLAHWFASSDELYQSGVSLIESFFGIQNLAAALAPPLPSPLPPPLPPPSP